MCTATPYGLAANITENLPMPKLVNILYQDLLDELIALKVYQVWHLMAVYPRLKLKGDPTLNDHE